MADIRIKDLTTEVSSTATGDFFVIDGTTGTRRTPAFNPTFGGNAAVTGTLTVNSTLTANGPASGITVNGAGITMDTDPVGSSASLRFVDGATPRFWIYKLSGDSNLYFRDMTNGRMQFQMLPGATSSNAISTFNSILSVTSTTASTTTSTGALVVGNGTSGGLGVGGAASIGGPILVGTSSDVYVSRVATGILDIRSASSPGTTARLDVTGTTSAGVGFRQSGTRDWFISAESAELRVTCGTSGSIFAVTNGNPVALRDTTASTSTSSGALVVSGGVGVAKEMYLGGGLLNVAKGGAGSTIEINADSGFASKLAMQRASTNRWTLEVDSSDVLTLKSLGTTAALTMTGTTSAEFVGSIKTAAPSGGTAANWKLGTVASVSPTSPNRTIEVDIGGTIYYIHAKTTNN